MKKKNEQANSKKKIQVWNCLPNRNVQCIQMWPFEHVAYNIVYLGLRVVSNDMAHIKGTL